MPMPFHPAIPLPEIYPTDKFQMTYEPNYLSNSFLLTKGEVKPHCS